MTNFYHRPPRARNRLERRLAYQYAERARIRVALPTSFVVGLRP